MDTIVVFTTTDNPDLAHRIAEALVAGDEAACVNIVPGIRSVYRWQGKICDEGEFLLIIKTAADKFEAVRARIRAMHSYQVPEVLALPVSAGDPSYLHWLHFGEMPK